MIRPLILLCSTLIAIPLLPITNALACTRDEAFNKMMAIGRAQQQRMLAAGNDHAKMIQAADLAKETGDVGKILAAEKYTEACSYYDKIAQKYGVDLKAAGSGMVTMQEIKKDGGKKGGSCSQADASIKLMDMTQKLQDKTALGDIPQGTLSNFLNDAQKHNDLIYTDPSAYCGKLDELQKKYKIQ